MLQAVAWTFNPSYAGLDIESVHTTSAPDELQALIVMLVGNPGRHVPRQPTCAVWVA
jgi:hypothetical protein